MLSKNKMKILNCLEKEEYMRPIEISKVTGIHKNTVSANLRLLRNEGLVFLLNPSFHIGRLYRITEKGRKIVRILDP